MVDSRAIPIPNRYLVDTNSEPLLDVARRKAREDGTGLRVALNALRVERRVRAQQLALADAPSAVKLESGDYKRVTNDPRWPFGVENELVLAPFGISKCGLPRTIPAETNNQGGRLGAAQAKREARDIIAEKLQRLGCDPIRIMADLAMECGKPEVRLRAAAELAAMIYPKLRGVESLQREEKTVFVIGIPSERPATNEDWLAGVKSIQPPIIEGTSKRVDDDVAGS